MGTKTKINGNLTIADFENLTKDVPKTAEIRITISVDDGYSTETETVGAKKVKYNEKFNTLTFEY